MRVTISKEFHFSASHQLTHLPEPHPCARLHGHNYRVVLALRGWPHLATGFVLDYRDLDAFKAYLDDTLDHRHLNDVLRDAEETTAEALAEHLLHVAIRLHGDVVYSVTVCETDKTAATVYREDV